MRDYVGLEDIWLKEDRVKDMGFMDLGYRIV